MFDSWLVIFPVAAVAALSLRIFASRRSLRVRTKLERWLRQCGFEPQRMERRWLTRGPFPDIRPAGVEHSGLLFHVRGRDRGGVPASGWVWLPSGWQWTSTERWRLHVDPNPDVKPRGIGTPVVAVALMAAAAVVLAIVSAIVGQHG
jgi:hypothetical protein